MKKIVLFLIISSVSNAQHLWQVYPDKVVRWNYFDGDEFNKNTINKEKWITALPWSDAVYQSDIYYTENNISFDNGNIRFILNKKDSLRTLASGQLDTNYFKQNKLKLIDGNKYQFHYTGGLLWSKKEYQYGYYEIKFKAPEGKGIWPAFWLFGAKPNNELDFFELKGEKEDELHVDIHCPDGCGNYKEGPFGYRRGWGHWVKTTQKLKENYNIVSGEWMPDYIKWYLNGELIAYSDHSFNLAMNLTAGTGIAKDKGPFAPGPDKETPFPNYFTVDYVRVYKTNVSPNYEEIKNNLSSEKDTSYVKTANDFKATKAKSKLKNNPDKKIRNENVITVSVMQLAKTHLSLRVVGLNNKDKCRIKIKNSSDQLIADILVTENSEMRVPFNESQTLTIYAEINNQIINEKINVQ
jgi:beta-glucanase (GH16 family)